MPWQLPRISFSISGKEQRRRQGASEKVTLENWQAK
jgi:hypothetical protein